MPFRRKRRWKSFVKKVHFVAEKELGTRSVLMNQQVVVTNVVGGNQLCLTTALYSANSTTSTWLNDIYQIGNMENASDPTSNAGINIAGSTKFLFQSGILDVTIRNTSLYNDGTSLITAGNLEVDVYEIGIKNLAELDSTTYGHLSALLNWDVAKKIGGTGTNCAISLRGATPFEFPYAISRFGIKIYKKTKYEINSGNTITYQLRDPRRHVLEAKNMTHTNGFNQPGWTRVVYIIAKLVPGLTVGTGQGTYQEQLSVGITRKYTYKVEGANDDRDRYVTFTNSVASPQ